MCEYSIPLTGNVAFEFGNSSATCAQWCFSPSDEIESIWTLLAGVSHVDVSYSCPFSCIVATTLTRVTVHSRGHLTIIVYNPEFSWLTGRSNFFTWNGWVIEGASCWQQVHDLRHNCYNKLVQKKRRCFIKQNSRTLRNQLINSVQNISNGSLFKYTRLASSSWHGTQVVILQYTIPNAWMFKTVTKVSLITIHTQTHIEFLKSSFQCLYLHVLCLELLFWNGSY